VIRNLLFLSPTRNLLYVSDFENGQLTRKFEHLACFYPGVLALAATTLDLPKSERELYMWAAEGLGHSCWIMYADQASGLGPELARMDGWPGDWRKGRWIDHVDAWQRSGSPGGKPPGVKDLSPPVKSGQQKDYHLDVSTYLSRPETLESMFVLWRTTGDVKWREHGWSIWEAIEKKTRTSSGYASVQSVDQAQPYMMDSMPSYFLSETIKYAYLLAIDEDPWPADKFVFNTEAHPLPIFKWRDWEKKKYSII
jgi:mannosyl-oligosaccharide alpha-1,2-mannosidase